MADGDREMAFYRAVEDLFATLRGVPHLMSPRDFQLLRSWWDEGIPLTAVTAGVTEVFAKRRERGDEDPVVSLGYCRHAVRRHGRRLAEMRTGQGAAEDRPAGAEDALRAELEALAGRLEAAAQSQSEARPRVATAVLSIRKQLETALEMTPSDAGELLFSLESSLLHRCLEALDETEREALEARARDRAGEGSEDSRRRRVLALRDRELRALLELPRLELM